MRCWSLPIVVVHSAFSFAQWQLVPNNIPLGEGIFGPGSLTDGWMIAPDTGVWSTSLVISPSSGTVQHIYYTDTDWLQHEQVFTTGSGNIEFIGIRHPHTFFYVRYYQASYTLNALSYTSTGVDHLDYGLYGLGSIKASPIGDTICIASWPRFPGSVRIVRATPNSTTVLDSLPTGEYPTAIEFIDTELGAMLTRTADHLDRVRISQNGGESWAEVLLDSTRIFRAIQWAAPSTLWMVGDSGLVIHTNDLGQTWISTPLPTPVDLRTVTTCSADSVWVGGANGKIYSTGNAGVQWEDRSLDDHLITHLQAFDNVIYAYATYVDPLGYPRRELYKLATAVAVPTLDGPSAWWAYTNVGIQLDLGGEEYHSSVDVVDYSGRVVMEQVRANSVRMDHLPAGVYLVRLRTDRRNGVAKVLWPPVGR